MVVIYFKVFLLVIKRVEKKIENRFVFIGEFIEVEFFDFSFFSVGRFRDGRLGRFVVFWFFGRWRIIIILKKKIVIIGGIVCESYSYYLFNF